jgi:hypothetical protein
METFIPMWERVLTDLVHPRPSRYPIPSHGKWYKDEDKQKKEEEEEEDDEVRYLLFAFVNTLFVGS